MNLTEILELDTSKDTCERYVNCVTESNFVYRLHKKTHDTKIFSPNDVLTSVAPRKSSELKATA